jgi:diguanylate cyclase
MITFVKNLRNENSRKLPPLGRRGRILLWAVIISFICGIIEFGEPLDDVIRGGRNLVRQHEYSGNVVVVGIDDKTSQYFDGLNYSRKVDAKVLDTLFANGAKRVFYDKAFADITDAESDKAFLEALQRHRGKIFLGALEVPDPVTGKTTILMPNKKFADDAAIVSLAGKATPFELSAIFPYRTKLGAIYIPSMASKIANTNVDNDEYFRPDWSIQARTVPTVSLSDIYNNTIKPSQIAGRDIVIGPNSIRSTDIHRIVSQGWLHGLYFHVIASETLQKGSPKNWGWFALWTLTLVLSICLLFAKKQRFMQASFFGATMLVIILPIYLDSKLISVDVVPSALLFGIIAFKSLAVRKAEHGTNLNIVSGLPNLGAMRSMVPQRASTLIALKIRNYSAIVAGFGEELEPDIIAEVKRRIALVSHEENVFHEGDTLLWFTDIDSSSSLSEHLEGLNRILSATMQLRGQPFDLLISFGVDADHERAMGVRIGSAMLCAQEAMQDNQIWKFYDPERRHESSWELSLLDSINHAIDNGEIWVAYQAKADLKTGKVIGAEALVRWSHPERGLVGPEQFIDIAERNNRIDRITELVLDHAIETAALINKDFGAFNIAVNLSVQMLQHPGLLTMISDALVRHGLPPEYLTLEITETGKLPQNDEVITVLRRIVSEGITLSLDDYGTGNATLDYLKLLPFGEVKIDKSFISNITHVEQDLILVQSTISMAHSLGCKVVGEGVETEEIRSILLKLGCDIAQGYHVGYPIRQLAFIQSLLDQGVKRKA